MINITRLVAWQLMLTGYDNGLEPLAVDSFSLWFEFHVLGLAKHVMCLYTTSQGHRNASTYRDEVWMDGRIKPQYMHYTSMCLTYCTAYNFVTIGLPV